MSFAARMTLTPLAHDPDAPPAPPVANGDVQAACDAVARSSPYLARLMGQEAGWLADALEDQPETVIAQVIAGLSPEGDVGSTLRQAKRRAALFVALADLCGVWQGAQVTRALTEFADAALEAALAHSLGRARLPDHDGTPGLVTLAMGKMGAFELNYSSDIDLICLFDQTRYAPADHGAARSALTRVVREAMALLSKPTAEGYVFRTDLRLRPEPSVTPLCLSMAAAEAYYEAQGRTWERAAHIKARAAAGDIAAGAAYLERLTPFVFRRHLDFAAIEDAHAIRQKIRDHKASGGPIHAAGHDLKLGRGGIREIEFFAQTQQLILGGRAPEMRMRGTVETLAGLAESGTIAPETATRLTAHYHRLRDLEHRVQMVQDAQTHQMPSTDAELHRIAALSGRGDVEGFVAEVQACLEEVEALISPLYGQEGPVPAPIAPEIETLAEEMAPAWASYSALRSERGRARFEALRPALLARLSAAGAPREALLSFDGFLSRLPAGVQLFSLFAAQPKLMDLFADICAIAPDLARYLGRNAGVLDAVLDGDFFAAPKTLDQLCAEARAALSDAGDYEAGLDAIRRWHKERHFQLGVQLLRGTLTRQEAGAAYGVLAEACLSALWPFVGAEFARKHGAIVGAAAAVMAMGSLGAGRLTARSDLDLIVIFEGAAEAVSDGPRPLHIRPYFARLTQALVTALSAPTAEGRLYEVDMRLRPSGRKGPVATSLSSFRAYQLEEAWVWEHLALSRGRVVLGPEALWTAIEAVRGDVLATGPGRVPEIVRGYAEMRARLAQSGPKRGALSLKHGGGGMQDIELAAQTQSLLAGAAARTTQAQLAQPAAFLSPDDSNALAEIYGRFADLQQAFRLLAETSPAPEDWPAGPAHFVTEGGDMAALEAQITRDMARAEQIIAGALARVAPPEASG